MNTAKRYLFQMRYIDTDIKNLESRIKAAEIRLTSLNSIRYGMPRTQGGQSSDWKDDLIDSIYSMKIKLTDLNILKYEKMIMTMSELHRMPHESYRDILSRFFLDGQSIAKIARDLETTERAIYSQYSRALKEFYEVNKDNIGKYELTLKGQI